MTALLLAQVYGLAGDDGRIRYVGRTTKTLGERLQRHRWQAASGGGTCPRRVSVWMREQGRVTIVPLEDVALEDLPAAELRWIRKLRDAGCDLVNALGNDWSPSPGQRVAISAHNRERFSDPVERERLADLNRAGVTGMKGRHHSAQTKEKISAAQKGIPKGPPSEETRRRMSESAKRRCAQGR